MLIREYVKRRARHAWIVFLVLLLVGNIGAAIVSASIIELDPKIVAIITLSMSMTLLFWMLYRVPCPCCRQSLGLGPAMDQLRKCPHCDVSFDTSLEQAVTVGEKSRPALTIRKYLARRLNRFVTTSLLMMVLALLVWCSLHDMNRLYGFIGGMVVATITLLVSIGVMSLTRCPRCAHFLGWAGWRAVSNRNPANRCTRCGVSFDEPMPARRSSADRQSE